MTRASRYVGAFCVLALTGCAPATESSSSGGPTRGSGGKADGAGFTPGIYYAHEPTSEEDGILAIALHEDPEGREGYAGQFDLAQHTAADWMTVHSSGWFRAEADGDALALRLESAEGRPVAELRYEDGELSAGERGFYRMNLLTDETEIQDCVAFEVTDFQFEEGFTVWEYPSVDVTREADGGYSVSFGGARFDAGDGDEVSVETGDDGVFRATVVTSYGTRYVLEIPPGVPSRGRALFAEEGETLSEMAKVVCPAPRATAPEPGVTRFTCTTRRAEADGTATIEFGVVALDDRDAMDLHWPDDVEEPIRVTPETSKAYTLVGGIADGYLRWQDDKLRLFTDQIGYEFGELELYENSDYTRGYFRFEMLDPDHTEFYTEVDCVHD